MSYYPAMLDLRDKKVLFVGGGWETEHKVKGLLDAGASVRLIPPQPHLGLEPLALNGLIEWKRREYREGALMGFHLAVSHPIDKTLNALVAKEAKSCGVWLNAVDHPQYCDFILPSVHRQGDLVISISTSGAAPALGVRIKQKLAEEFGEEYAVYLQLLRRMRPMVAKTFPDDFEARKAAWYRMVDSEALEGVRRGDLDGASAILLKALPVPANTMDDPGVGAYCNTPLQATTNSNADPVGAQGLAPLQTPPIQSILEVQS